MSRVSRAQCSMSSATQYIPGMRSSECAAHDALQTRDLTESSSEYLAVPDQRRTASRVDRCAMIERLVQALALRRIRDTRAFIAKMRSR
jgi:hypothetical protein